jgi:HD-like signal output (HDOD) protein
VSAVTVLDRPKESKLPLAPIGVPPFPAVALKALQVVSNDRVQFRELNELLRTDTALSSEILRIANSALYGIPEVFENLSRATVHLGLDRIRNVILTVAMRKYFGESSGASWVQGCWRHNLACALIAEELAKKNTPIEKDIAYTAGLLHDMGRLAIAVAYPEKYGSFLMNSTEHVSTVVLERERELFGVNHCEAGGSLASWWRLPESLVAVMSHHHDPATDGDSEVLAIVRLSCMTATALDFAVVQPVQPRTYDQFLAELPERERKLLPREPAELSAWVANTMKTIELT